MGNLSSSYVGVAPSSGAITFNWYFPIWQNVELCQDWLTVHVGQQGIVWEWLRPIKISDDATSCKITLFFAKGKEQWATIAAIKWS